MNRVHPSVVGQRATTVIPTKSPAKIPIPADEDAEKCVLAALLELPNAQRELESQIDPKLFAELFFSPASKIILQAIHELHNNGTPGDIILLTQLLDKQGLLEQVGG